MNIGHQIANRRKLLGLTQRSLAEALHVSFQAISKWENGTTLPDITLLAPLAQLLHTSVDDIREKYGKSVDAYFREVFAC